MPLEKITCGVNYTTNLLRDNVNGLIESNDSFSLAALSSNDSVIVTMGLTAKTLPYTHDKLNSKMLNLGGTFTAAGESYPNNRFITSLGTIDYGTGTQVSPRIIKHFIFKGLKFEFEYKENRGSYEVIVDGVSNGIESIPSTTGAIKFGSVEFQSEKTRFITVVGENSFLGDFYTETYDTVITPPTGKKVLIAGDSYTEGVGADFGLGYVNVLTSKYSIVNLVNSGLGGTGYVKDNNGRPALIDRYQTDIIGQAPDVVVLAMGINDLNSDLSLVSQNANQIVQGIKASLPDTAIVMLSSWSPRTPEQPTTDINNTLINVANNNSIAFLNVSSLDNPWFYGTGNSGNLQGDGNCDVAISADNTHPTNYGHEYIASSLFAYISSIGVSVK